MSMKFKDMLNKKRQTLLEDDQSDDSSLINSEVKDDNYYFNMVNPDTQERYDIPLLSLDDPGYYYEYIYYMKMKESTPDTFNKILGWD